jgi:hypothetical protein
MMTDTRYNIESSYVRFVQIQTIEQLMNQKIEIPLNNSPGLKLVEGGIYWEHRKSINKVIKE